MQLLIRPRRGTLILCCLSVLGTLFWMQSIQAAFAETEKGDRKMQNLATQIKNYQKSGDFDKALGISERALQSDPVDLEAYDARWRLIVKMFSETDARKMIVSEIEALLQAHPETPEILNAAHWGYMLLPDRAKNIPDSFFDKMLQYPKTELHLLALLGLAEQSEDASRKWHYYQRIIDEFTESDVPELSWYLLAYEEMLWLVAEDNSLASENYRDELIDRYLKAHLVFCQNTQQSLVWAYIGAVESRLKHNNRLDKALEILKRAGTRLGEAEEQTWIKRNDGSIEKAHNIDPRAQNRLRALQHKR